MHFTLAGGEPFCFAGLWTRWQPPDGGDVDASCTIITTDSNELVRPVHHRMPAILCDLAAWEAWLDPALDQQVAALLEPIAADRLMVAPANPTLNSARHEGPDCLALAAYGRSGLEVRARSAVDTLAPLEKRRRVRTRTT